MLSQVLADGASDGVFFLSADPRDEALAFAAMIDGLALYTRVTKHVDDRHGEANRQGARRRSLSEGGSASPSEATRSEAAAGVGLR